MNRNRAEKGAAARFNGRTENRLLTTLADIFVRRNYLSHWACLVLCASILGAQAARLYVPNGSFESPTTTFADPRMDAWQKTPKPMWFVEDPQDPVRQWFNLSGQFLNVSTNDPAYIDNLHGAQAAFLFALPEVGIFQELRWPATSNAPAGEARYRPGRAYRLSLGVMGGGGAMTNGVPLRASLYYLDASSNRVPVASLVITNTPDTFSNFNHLVEFALETPKITPQDPCAGQIIGVEIMSLAGFDNMGGYWDLDNIRVEEIIPVPNGSFESPRTPFVDIVITGWEKSPKPFWFDEGQGFLWSQLTGVFVNPAVTNAEHTPNMHGSQAIWLFAVPQVGLYLDRYARDMMGQRPTPEFDAVYEVGQAYELTVAVFGGGGAMTNGASMRIGLYYLDEATNRVPVASTSIVYTNEVFVRFFRDYKVRIPTVKPTDPWAGRPVGIELLSTTGFDKQGGFFDIDNVRLAAFQEPQTVAPRVTNGQFQGVVRGEPGDVLEAMTTADLRQPTAHWTPAARLTNQTGHVIFSILATDADAKYLLWRKQP
ncbi:hypothetical protein NXS98_03335 [Fontisphaera persica]|uniref:hypothetical protein n=1 Tax=Fontisphaera persica TaxID=2974023 RepID=UPI0024C0D603|nr:hypothetical protein [Fontisphaera persica]WCJ60173.1 hypothetical protein NXS98_03335 [Fontisphaera persica]